MIKLECPNCQYTLPIEEWNKSISESMLLGVCDELIPLNNKYVAVYNKKYIFKVSGYFTLHDTPSHFYMYSTKEQAEIFLKLYLEWKGKDIVKMEANI